MMRGSISIVVGDERLARRDSLKAVPTAIAIGLAAAVTPCAAQNTAWGNAEVDGYVRAHSPDFAAWYRDPFATPPRAPQPLSTFQLRFPVERPPFGTRGFDFDWRYDAGTRTLEVYYTSIPDYHPSAAMYEYGPSFSGMEAGQRLPYFESRFATSVRATRSDGGTGTNAFGATARITNRDSMVRGITALTTGPGAQPPRDLVYTVNIEPERARTLVEHLRLDVLASPMEWRPGHWVLCNTSGSLPTLDAPTRRQRRECYLTVQITGIRFVDGRDGSVLREWTPATTAEGETAQVSSLK